MKKTVALWVVIAFVIAGSGVAMHDEAALDVDSKVVGIGCVDGGPRIAEVKIRLTSNEESVIEPVWWTDDKLGNVRFGWEPVEQESRIEPNETVTFTLRPKLNGTNPTVLAGKQPSFRVQVPGAFKDIVLPRNQCSSNLTYRTSIHSTNITG